MKLPAIQPANEQAPNTQAKQKQKPSIQTGPSSGTKAYKAYPDKYADACYQAQDHAAADLCAQWRTTIAAEKAADAATAANNIMGVGAILSFIGVVLVLFALGQARKANQIALDTANRQLRAYLGITNVEMNSKNSEIWIEFKNFGQTPARNVKAKSRRIWPKKSDEWQPHDYGIIDPTNQHRALNGTPDNTPVKLDPTKIPELAIEISHEDVFGNGFIREVTYFWPSKLKIPTTETIFLYVKGNTASETQSTLVGERSRETSK